MNKILIIQTAFIGDVILATSLIESLVERAPSSEISVLVRKGNESVLKHHPHIKELFIWDKKESKYKGLKKIAKEIKKEKFEAVINLQRFASSGWLTWKSGAKLKIGFKKNPFSVFFTHSYKHTIGDGKHEIERNIQLIEKWGEGEVKPPRLYPSSADIEHIQQLTKNEKYVVMAPSSVWFTKQLPFEKWLELIASIPEGLTIFLIGAPADRNYLNQIASKFPTKRIHNTAGELSMFQSTALIAKAKMSYVNDSAPLHMASAVNAPVTAFFCSTVPAFGFGPLSDVSYIKESKTNLNCRPCGLHGKKQCPKQHFKCGFEIDVTS